jgi:hypothetical protein
MLSVTEKPFIGSKRSGGASEPINTMPLLTRRAWMIFFRHSGGTLSSTGVPSCGIIATISPPRIFW